jgi:hypothetical protein
LFSSTAASSDAASTMRNQTNRRWLLPPAVDLAVRRHFAGIHLVNHAVMAVQYRLVIGITRHFNADTNRGYRTDIVSIGPTAGLPPARS